MIFGHLFAVDAGGIFTDVGRSLREAFYMFWETLWALVLGFGLSGAVQALVSREQMQAKLGGRGPGSVARASLYGMASSSCSYAASAMARSLFKKGADFVSAMVFMFASTNLVVELGIVLLVLIGWQFAVSEFVGGAIMVILLALVGALFLRGRALAEARSRVELTDTTGPHDHKVESAPGPAPAPSDDAMGERLRSREKWAEAATYTMSDVKMLRREMAIGYVVAGMLVVLVPQHVWNGVFIHGHGFATTLENVVVGPFVAMISFVCSIGNVPLAAALWKGGISFGGVVSFVFADLIAFPLLLVYRKFYGTRMALRLMILFWGVMSVAGLATEGIFRALGWVPTARPARIVPEQLSWDYTTFLNIAALALFFFLYRTYRRRGRGGTGPAGDLAAACPAHEGAVHAPV